MTIFEMTLPQKRDLWTLRLKEQVHTPILEDDGDLDIWVLDEGHHNGPGCLTCHQNWCWHCTHPDEIGKCSP